jgi:hypothetical protein
MSKEFPEVTINGIVYVPKEADGEQLFSLEEIKSCCHDDSAGGGTLYLSWDRLLELAKTKMK